MPKSPAEKLSEAKAKSAPKPTKSLKKRPWNSIVGERRKRLGLTMREVADAVGITSAAVCEIEHGSDPLLTTARKYARFFGESIECLWPYLNEETKSA